MGNYFKPVRASRLMAQAQETQRAVSKFKGTISSQRSHNKSEPNLNKSF